MDVVQEVVGVLPAHRRIGNRVGLRAVDFNRALEVRTEIGIRPGERVHDAVAVDVAGRDAFSVEAIGELNLPEVRRIDFSGHAGGRAKQVGDGQVLDTHLAFADSQRQRSVDRIGLTRGRRRWCRARTAATRRRCRDIAADLDAHLSPSTGAGRDGHLHPRRILPRRPLVQLRAVELFTLGISGNAVQDFLVRTGDPGIECAHRARFRRRCHIAQHHTGIAAVALKGEFQDDVLVALVQHEQPRTTGRRTDQLARRGTPLGRSLRMPACEAGAVERFRRVRVRPLSEARRRKATAWRPDRNREPRPSHSDASW